jgi:hypothetical protein
MKMHTLHLPVVLLTVVLAFIAPSTADADDYTYVQCDLRDGAQGAPHRIYRIARNEWSYWDNRLAAWYDMCRAQDGRFSCTLGDGAYIQNSVDPSAPGWRGTITLDRIAGTLSSSVVFANGTTDRVAAPCHITTPPLLPALRF